VRIKLGRWALGIAAALALAGCASLGAGRGAGGAAPGALDLELGYGGAPPVDLPIAPPDTSAAAAQALQEIESRRKAAEAVGRESRPDPTRRPDLDHDVTQGIQSRGLDRAIGR
jgi:hypothetical protein